MSGATFSLLLGGLALLGHIAAVPIALRAASRLAPVIVHIASASMIHVLQIVAAVILGARTGLVLSYWHGAAVIGAGAIAYLFLFSAVYKSVSLRMLVCLREADGTPVSASALAKHVVAPEFAQRAALLVASGVVMENGGHYTISSEGRRMAVGLTRLQRIFGVARSGLY